MPTRTEPEPLSKRLRAVSGELKLVAYLMAGHPSVGRCAEVGRRLATSDVAALELGIPFSDPLADGPVIQRAGQAALRHGMSVARALDLAADISEEGGAPIVLMTYVNPVLAYDPRRFAADAAQAGVAGVIFPDLPAEEAQPVAGWMRSAGLDVIFLVAPTTSDERIKTICAASSGFVYCVTVTGITGMRAELPPSLDSLLTRVRASTGLPVAAGFGISKPEHLLALRGVADAAVVGSAIVSELDAGRDPAELVKELLRACR